MYPHFQVPFCMFKFYDYHVNNGVYRNLDWHVFEKAGRNGRYIKELIVYKGRRRFVDSSTVI